MKKHFVVFVLTLFVLTEFVKAQPNIPFWRLKGDSLLPARNAWKVRESRADTLKVMFSDATFAIPALGAYGSDTGSVLAGTIDGVGVGYTTGDTLTIAQVGSDSLAKIVVTETDRK